MLGEPFALGCNFFLILISYISSEILSLTVSLMRVLALRVLFLLCILFKFGLVGKVQSLNCMDDPIAQSSYWIHLKENLVIVIIKGKRDQLYTYTLPVVRI